MASPTIALVGQKPNHIDQYVPIAPFTGDCDPLATLDTMITQTIFEPLTPGGNVTPMESTTCFSEPLAKFLMQTRKPPCVRSSNSPLFDGFRLHHRLSTKRSSLRQQRVASYLIPARLCTPRRAT